MRPMTVLALRLSIGLVVAGTASRGDAAVHDQGEGEGGAGFWAGLGWRAWAYVHSEKGGSADQR